MKIVAEPTLETLHLLATTITQRHARGHKRYAADDEHLTRKCGVIASLGELVRRGLLLARGSLCSCLRNLRFGLGLGLRLSLGMILVVVGLCSSQCVLGIAKFGQRGGIGVVGIGQFGVGIGSRLLKTRLGVDSSLIARVGSIELGQLVLGRPARIEHRGAGSKRSLMINVFKVCLELLGGSELGLGLDDLEVRIDDGFVGGLELLLGIGDTGDGSVIGGLGVVDRLLSAGEALEGLVCGGALGIGGLDLLLCVGQGLRLGGNYLLGVRKSGRGVRI